MLHQIQDQELWNPSVLHDEIDSRSEVEPTAWPAAFAAAHDVVLADHIDVICLPRAVASANTSPY